MFDFALSRLPGRTVSFPAALFAHAAVIAVFTAASWRATDEPDDLRVPAEPIPILRLPAPAGRPDASVRTGGAPRPERVRRTRPFVAPRALPDSIASVRDVPAETTASSEERSDDGEGELEGIGDGPTGFGFPEGIPDATGDVEIPRPGGSIMPPQLAVRIEPIYPEAARRAHLEGLVVLDAVIAISGDIEDVRIVKSAGALLDSAASDAVRRWKYRAAKLDGRPVRVLLSVTVSFRLH